MLEPQTPKLRIGRCVSESFNAWTGNLPVLFLATLLAILLAFIPPFLFVATITGLLLIMQDAISGDPVRIRDVIRPLRNPVRFVCLNSFTYLGLTLWMGALFVLVVGILPAMRAMRLNIIDALGEHQ